MKYLFTLVILSLSLITSAQDYQLFNLGSKKVFRSPDTLTKSYNLIFDSVINTGNKIIYYPYMDVDDWNYVEDNDCWQYGWFCHAKNKPKWIGDTIVQVGEVYTFLNKDNLAVILDFGITGTEEQIFYQDAGQRFSLTQTTQTPDTIVFAGIVDTVKRYTISHTNLQGVGINSPLDGWEIIVGKNLGLLSFFRVDAFPAVLMPLRLIGNRAPDAGFYQLTLGHIEDHQPGDVIQYRYRSSWPWQNLYTERYTKHEFLQRTETSNEFQYRIRVESFDIDSLNFTIDTITLKYEKNTVIAEIPFDQNYDVVYYYQEMSVKDYCGLSLWTYGSYDAAIALDPQCNLWCDLDMGGLGGWNTMVYVAGVGLYKNSFSSARPEGHSYGTEIVYFNKDGHSCGVEVIGINEINRPDNKLVISPNPSAGSFSVKGKLKGRLTITDMNGNIVIEMDDYKGGREVGIHMLKAGVYIVRISDTNSSAVGKLVVL